MGTMLLDRYICTYKYLHLCIIIKTVGFFSDTHTQCTLQCVWKSEKSLTMCVCVLVIHRDWRDIYCSAALV